MIIDFFDEFEALKIKHGVKEVICFDVDGNAMGYVQLYKMIEANEESPKTAVFSYSSQGNELCPCCKENKGKPHDH